MTKIEKIVVAIIIGNFILSGLFIMGLGRLIWLFWKNSESAQKKQNTPETSTFQLQKEHLHCQISLTPSEAILGGAIEIPTIDGPVKINIPRGVKPGQHLHLNKGYVCSNGTRGDRLVEVQIAIPSEISPQERELYEQLRLIETFNPREVL